MSGLQKIDPTAQKFIVGALQSGKDCSYCKRTKNLIGQVVESVTVEATATTVNVIETERRQPVLGDWLQVVGGVAIVLLGLFVIVQGIKGVLKSEVSTGYGTIHATAIGGHCVGVDRTWAS